MISYYECDDTCMSYLASRQLMLAINSYLTPLPVVGFYWRHSFIGDTSKYWRAWNFRTERRKQRLAICRKVSVQLREERQEPRGNDSWVGRGKAAKECQGEELSRV